jgi:hypothetical protein
MALLVTNGTLNTETGVVTPNNSGTWANLSGSTWSSWSSWVNAPADPLIWLTDPITVPYTTPYTLRIETQAQGQVSYVVYTSNTGNFGGEETTTTINSGATGVGAFEGRYIIVAIKVANTGARITLENVQVKATDYSLDMAITVDDTAILAGSAGSRTIPLPRTIAGIVNITATARPITAYVPNVYVTDMATSTTVYAEVVDKTFSAPKIGLFKIDGYPVDGGVDIRIKALPEQQMSGNNLISV